MKKIISSILVTALVVFLSGCATPYPVGLAFTDAQLPTIATSNTAGTKKGTGICKTYFGLIAVGDASIDKAAKEAGIKKISHVDWDVENVLGVYGIYTVTVYGE